ncbi:AraC family transcriptional regulator [Rhodopseudomonas thermotolerans]|uniref:AraC family transcriptional regulator n=2 Tax=Rhodopseudomonas TaxID=1073 RepID=A0A336JPP1_9BRAD|nr:MULTISPECIES: helix-turn-helix domain-containing protein [Rhodopseudomonas]RED32627.1 AraC family transcriptional regulator [Rhodopseudomonas pentothenatexigens]REF93636.1 AraC family transcriptional regulator [Rhodopseudomonas thermotolerans]SSW91522.1 AraC family transcriptional regulator [Rhodopseudomonas pentothenatexigens]
MPTLFSADDAAPHRRLALWQDIICDVYVQLDCSSNLGSSFHGSVSSGALGRALCSTVSSCAQRVARTPARIACAREESVLFALGTTGHGGVVQDGREAVIRPGEFAFYDTTRPYELQFDGDFSQRILQVPREMIARRIRTEELTATTFSSARPLDKLAYDFIASICALADRVDHDTADRLTEQAVDLVAMVIADRLDGRRPATSHRAAMLYRLKAHIHSRLHDPELSAAGVAAALGMSPRYVSDLFAGDATSFQRYVLAQRLERCARDLVAPRLAGRRIGEIAFAWGFNDLSHFGRVFRERYGVSPRDYRHGRPTY